MTESEAIKIFNDLLDVPCEMLVKYDSVINSEKKQALVRLRTAEEIAIQALEKQIPKKPIPIDYKKYMDTVKNALFLKGAYWCPNCKHVVKCGTYCSDCGQKLDWSDEE